jgi:hypothetical protein
MTPAANDHRPEDQAADASDYRALVAELRAQNTPLLARLAELERQLSLNSFMPPSSDGLTKRKPVRVVSLREQTGKKPGGQKGEPGLDSEPHRKSYTTAEHFPSSVPVAMRP